MSPFLVFVFAVAFPADDGHCYFVARIHNFVVFHFLWFLCFSFAWIAVFTALLPLFFVLPFLSSFLLSHHFLRHKSLSIHVNVGRPFTLFWAPSCRWSVLVLLHHQLFSTCVCFAKLLYQVDLVFSIRNLLVQILKTKLEEYERTWS